MNEAPRHAIKSSLPELSEVIRKIQKLGLDERVKYLNAVRKELSEHSPFQSEPVDCIQWIPMSEVQANDYNPNNVAPPEMELLRLSIMADGYTQPIVGSREDDRIVVVDGFHRNRVGRECPDVAERIKGYLPVVQIRTEQTDRSDRMASTVRHNRARGKHSIDGMAEIVLELKRRNWSSEKIGKQLGMDPDEVLRLAQITGLADALKDNEFSEAWEAIIDIDDEVLDALEEVST